MDEDRRVFFAIKIGDQVVNLVIKLALESRAQKTIQSFHRLIISNVYKGTQLVRVVSPEFLIQGGHIPRFHGELLRSEEVEESTTRLDKKGLICVANDIHQEKSSEFFITLDDLSQYDSIQGRFVVLGVVENGLEKLIDLTRDVEVDEYDRPLKSISITKSGELQKKNKGKQQETRKTHPQETKDEKLREDELRRSDKRYHDHSNSYRSHEHNSHHRHRRDISPGYRDRNSRRYEPREYASGRHDHHSSHRSRYHDRDYSDRDHKRLKKSSSGSEPDELRKGRGFR